MEKTDTKLREVRATRQKTLALVEDLDQTEIERPEPGGWSVGQLLDHLHRADTLYRGEIEKLIELQRCGKPAVITVALAEMEFPVPYVPRAILPLADVPLCILNFFIPNPVREFFLRNRIVKAEAPPVLLPAKGKLRDELIGNLRRGVQQMEELFAANAELDFSRLRYYHPLFGYNDVFDIIGLMVSHEQRHQTQLFEMTDALRKRRK